ncbi:NADH-quinone oxidoreductase subunit K [Mycobacterium tuberculosis]|nr:NADH-quinone oxidoreductase subunit K [Mycobacterium tuberculosis]
MRSAPGGGAVAAAEAAIGLAILVTLFRTRRTINVGEVDSLKG